MKKLWSVILAAFVLGIVVGIVVNSTPTPVHAQSIGFSPLAAMAATASACPPSAAGGWTLCGYGTATTGYAMCVSFNAGACNPLTAQATTLPFSAITGTASLSQLPQIPFTQMTGQIAPSQVPAITTSVTSTAVTTVQ
jgi:hypothetical protein